MGALVELAIVEVDPALLCLDLAIVRVSLEDMNGALALALNLHLSMSFNY